METRSTLTGAQAHAQQQAYQEWTEYHAQQTPMAVYHGDRYEHLASISQTAPVTTGRVAQFGVDAGLTLRLLSALYPRQRVLGFDAWHLKSPGLPDVWTGNIDHSRAFTWSPDAYEQLRGSMPLNVQLVPGLFDHQEIQTHMGDSQAQLIHIDCDTGPATSTVLEAIRPNLGPGTRILFDEYCNYPGWRQHEHGAWIRFCDQQKIRYRYLGQGNMDVSIEIL
jgi:hypothetical protein|tara:strand:- start:185 stop:850 length:666 start_codon:yes stop_codon:yes gene_type:complete